MIDPSGGSTAGADPLDGRGLRILGAVAAHLAADLESSELLTRIAGVLGRELGGDCTIWLRTPDGAAYRPIVAPGREPPAERSSGAFAAALHGGAAPGRLLVPLIHESERLGVIDVGLPAGPAAETLRQVVEITGRVLAPLLGTTELSEDLASEVAARTREIDAQRRFTSKIIDSLPVGLYVIDREYRIQAWNRKRETGTHGLERDEVLGKTVFDVMHRQPGELLREEFDRVFASGMMEQLEVTSESSGDPREYRVTKIPMRLDEDEVTHVITIGEDITQWKQVQQQVAQTEKLAAVGQLAAGVMHELNNPLATIGACVEALTLRAEDLPAGPRAGVEEYLRIIESELGRCEAIVDGLLDFSRPRARAKRTVHVNDVVEDALFLVKHHDKFKRITLRRDLAPSLPAIEANPEQLIQVFLAIMLNAIDAMDGHGVLTVRTVLNPARADEVLITVGDTGVGIAREDLPKIFEPFFTTKQPGRGTGLGLSICYGIVQQHGGRLVVDSQPGMGSEFGVMLPVRGAHEEGA